MKRYTRIITALVLTALMMFGTAVRGSSLDAGLTAAVSVEKIDGLSEDFIMGADVSSLLSLEASGRVFYGFDGRPQDLMKTLHESGINYIRVRVWNDPFDENGNGYGGGNCTVDTAIELGKRAAEYGMGLLVDFHYSDFWADPGKQQAPKAWQDMTLADKTTAIYEFTVDSINRIQQSGVKIGMVQVGNETTGGLCGETETEKRYALMRTAAKAVRDTDDSILIAAHFTNPEKKLYAGFAEDLKNCSVDYDIFATSFYPEFHGTIYNLKEQLAAVHELTGKKVMIAETSWAYDSDILGAYKHSVQGQADEIADCVNAMTELGDYAVGVFYWEPAWIDVPGDTEEERAEKRELYGAGWASSYAAAYDPYDAGQYYGATACIPSSLFDPDGHPLYSLRTFRYLREGTAYQPKNYVNNPSFEEDDTSMWRINGANAGSAGRKGDPSNARDGSCSLHFWSDQELDFTVEQTVADLPEGEYDLSLSIQGDVGKSASIKLYAVCDGVRIEQSVLPDGWKNWKVPLIGPIVCNSGSLTIGIEIKAAAGSWGSIDCVELVRRPKTYLLGDADGDGEVTIIDATNIQKKLANLPLSCRFNETAADTDGDDKVTIIDATYIQRWLADFENNFRINERFIAPDPTTPRLDSDPYELQIIPSN